MKNLTVSLAFVLTAVSVHAQSYDFMSALKSVKYVQRGANVVVVDPRPADNVYGGDTHEFYFDYNSASQYYQVSSIYPLNKARLSIGIIYDFHPPLIHE